MIRLMTCLFALTLAATGETDADKKDLDRLQGEWIMAAMEANGQVVPGNRLMGTTLTIKGNAYILKVKDKEHRCTLTLDAGKDPREVDMRFEDGANKDKVGKAIYKIDGDTFKLVRGLDVSQDRPREFATWPDTNIFVVTWKRK